MRVRGKMYVEGKRFSHTDHMEHGRTRSAFEVTLKPVTKVCGPMGGGPPPQPDPEDEDSIFGDATPSGECKLLIYGDPGMFPEVGGCVYVDFTPVPTR